MTLQNYPQATIVGVLQGLSSPPMNQATELGTVISDQERLVLVR